MDAIADAAEEPVEAGIGSVVGRYELLAHIGTGASGAVYSARHVLTGRRVALKIFPSLRLSDSLTRSRFLREAELAAELDHANVAAVFDAGEDRERALNHALPYMAMQFIDGQPLDRHVMQARLRASECVRLIRESCRGIEHAHSRGVLHRDLKPANILVASDGRPVIVDFGLAKRAGDPATHGSIEKPVLGTPIYASPEQCRAETADVRSDVYSLGVTLFRLLLPDHHPHLEATQPGVSEWKLRRAIGERPGRRARQIDPQLDRNLDAIVAKAIAFDPADRYQTAAEFGADLQHWLNGEPINARPPKLLQSIGYLARRYRRQVTIAAAMLLLTVALLSAATVPLIAARNRAHQAAALAEEAAARSKIDGEIADEIAEFLENLLATGSPDVKSPFDFTVGELLKRADESIEGKFVGRPLVEAGVRLSLGRALAESGFNSERSRYNLERAIELFDQHAKPGDLRTFEARYEYAVSFYREWDSVEGERKLTELLSDLQDQLEPTHELIFKTRKQIISAVFESGDLDRATTMAEALLADIERAPDVSPMVELDAVILQSMLLHASGNLEELESMLIRWEGLAAKVYGPYHLKVMSAQLNLGMTQIKLGKFYEGIGNLRSSVTWRRSIFGPGHENTLYGEQVLALALAGRDSPGDLDEAAELMEGVIRGRRTQQPFSPLHLEMLHRFAELEARRGESGHAAELARERDELLQQALTTDQPPVQLLSRWAGLLLEDGQDSVAFLDRAIEVVSQSYGEKSAEADHLRASRRPAG